MGLRTKIVVPLVVAAGGGLITAGTAIGLTDHRIAITGTHSVRAADGIVTVSMKWAGERLSPGCSWQVLINTPGDWVWTGKATESPTLHGGGENGEPALFTRYGLPSKGFDQEQIDARGGSAFASNKPGGDALTVPYRYQGVLHTDGLHLGVGSLCDGKPTAFTALK